MNRAALALAGLCALRVATAGDHVVLAGSEWSRLGGYTYAGVISPLGEGTLGDGLVMRHWLERLTYEYDKDGGTVDAVRYGYAPALGYQAPLWGGHVGGYAGLRLAHANLSPDDPGNRDEGDTARFFLQADAIHPVGAGAENQLVAEFETRYGGYYVRDRLMFRLGNGLSLGPEAVVKGGDDYDGWQAGVSLGGIRLLPALSVTVRAGIAGQRDESNCGYFGVEFVVPL